MALNPESIVATVRTVCVNIKKLWILTTETVCDCQLVRLRMKSGLLLCISTARGKQEGSVHEYVWVPQRYRQCLALRIAFVWVIVQRVLVISYRRFGTTYRYHFQCPSKTKPIGCPETSVINYHYSVRNNPEERNFLLLSGGSVKSRILPRLYMLLIYLTTPSVPAKLYKAKC